VNKDCGDDGCGGSCGQCNSGYLCVNYHCIDNTPDPDVSIPDDAIQPDAAVKQDIEKSDFSKDEDGTTIPDKGGDEPHGMVIDTTLGLADGESCPDGTVYRYGMCMTVQKTDQELTDSPQSGGCSANAGTRPVTGIGWMLILLLSLFVFKVANDH